MSKDRIADGEDHDDWITLRDPKTGQKLYSKVPPLKKKTDYEYEMRKKMKSNRPALPIIILKMRVVRQAEFPDAQSE